MSSDQPRGRPTTDFEYDLPADRIARYPAAERDGSRLLVLHRTSDLIEHRGFRDLPEYLRPGDALVLNDTRVIPARLIGQRAGGGRAEILLVEPIDGPAASATVWRALVRPGARLRARTRVRIDDALSVDIITAQSDGTRTVRLVSNEPTDQLLQRIGQVPLPPYLERDPEEQDVARYQTVYACVDGSVAAPTAGLHFTADLLARIAEMDVHVVRVVLHVGPGTFRPVTSDDPTDHDMHAERFEVPSSAAHQINVIRAAGGHVWAVGTTVARALESATLDDGLVRAVRGQTSLFIRQPYRFKVVDRLLTNFHLPRSTLLMLVSAFGGHDRVMRAYHQAVERGYRFYSYGDAMAVL